jgi:hypothetical protein
MTLLEPTAQPSADALMEAEALIEEARQRHRRRQLRIAGAVGVLLFGIVAGFAFVGGSGGGGTRSNAAGGSGSSASAALPLAFAPPSQALLLSCAVRPALQGQTPHGAHFTLVRAGMAGRTQWTYWFATPSSGPPIYALVGGSGGGAFCIEGGGGGGFGNEETVSQFPGYPLGFVTGYTTTSRARITGTANGEAISGTAHRFGSSPYAYLFAEITGLHCAPSISQPFGLYDSLVVEGTGSAQHTDTDLDETTTGVLCGQETMLGASPAAELLRAPRTLRMAIERTLAARSAEVQSTVASPASRPAHAPQVAIYNAKYRYEGPTELLHAHQIIIGSTLYALELTCAHKTVVTEAPTVDSASAMAGLTVAQTQAFSALFDAIHRGTHLVPVPGGFRFSSDLLPVNGNGVAVATRGAEPVLQGVITISNGYVRSITTTRAVLECDPAGPSCEDATTTRYLDFNTAPIVALPYA